MLTAEADGDVRLLIGAFENGQMLGVAFASYADADDIASNGIELNGLWVYPQHRGRGVSLMLVTHLLDFFRRAGREQVVIYSFHEAPSNRFYRKFGCRVLRQDEQMKEKLAVDVFISDIAALDTAMRRSLSRLSSAD
jgi:GNAT superfamily N-acetyltransferase